MSRSRTLALAGLSALFICVAVIVGFAAFGGETHKLHATFDAAVQMASGQEVRVAGRKVGEVGSIETVDGRAVVELNIQEDDVWPLPRGTTAGLRWGSTTSLAYRYVELHPGPKSAPDLPDDGVLKICRHRDAVRARPVLPDLPRAHARRPEVARRGGGRHGRRPRQGDRGRPARGAGRPRTRPPGSWAS